MIGACEKLSKVVLAYSGGLDSAVMLTLLKEKYGFAEVVPVLVDVGQGDDDIETAKERAGIVGIEPVFFDAKKEFATDYIFRCIKANGSYQGYPVGTSMSRILIASKVAEVAVREGAEAVAHGCTGKGNDQYRMEVAFRYYTPDIRIVAPVRELDLTRSVEEEMLRKQGIEPAKKVGKIGGDINMWSHSIGSGQMEDLSTQVESDYLWTVPIERTPETPTSISISYRNGVPTSVNGENDPVKMIVDLNETAGKNGIGKIDILEDGIMGFKSREIYEAPAATIFLKTHGDLEHLALTKDQLRLKCEIDRVWADMVYHGMWLHPLRKDLDAFIDSTQKYMNGTVTVKLHKGNVHIARRECDDSLFAPEIRSIKKSTFDQKEATGSVNMYTLQYGLFKSKKR